MRWSWRGGIGGLSPTTHQGQTLAATAALCFDSLLSWICGYEEWSIHTSQTENEVTESSCCWKSEFVPLHHRMLGGGNTWEMVPLGDYHHLGRRLVIGLSACAERLAAMWCIGARQGLLSALDYKRGCAILLPNTTRRRRKRRNKVVNCGNYRPSVAFTVNHVCTQSETDLLAFIGWNTLSHTHWVVLPCALHMRTFIMYVSVYACILHLPSETHVSNQQLCRA